MKLIVRIFNIVIMALSLLATVLLFTTPTFSFNSNVGINVKKFSEFVPSTPYTEGMKIEEMLGTEEIHVGIKFAVTMKDVPSVMSADRDTINKTMISPNVDDLTALLHEPVDLITDYAIKTVMKNLAKEEIEKQVEIAKNQYGATDSTAQEIMEEVGIDDEYITNLSNNVYLAANEDEATIDTLTNCLYEQVDETLAKVEESGCVDTSRYNEESKVDIKNKLVSAFDQLKLVKEDGKLKKISQLSYLYLSDYLAQQLSGKVEDEVLVQKADETVPQYADRLISVFVLTQIPTPVYQIIGYTSLGIMVAIIAFAAIWLAIFGICLYKTLSKNPGMKFGVWFWIIGAFQLILGLGITIAGKFALPKVKIPFIMDALPIKSIVLAPRTSALIPSIIFIGFIALAIVYVIIRSFVRKEER